MPVEIKKIDATADRTTDTANTFTAPAAGNEGCCMTVVNVDDTNTITLDANPNFAAPAGADVGLGPKIPGTQYSIHQTSPT